MWLINNKNVATPAPVNPTNSSWFSKIPSWVWVIVAFAGITGLVTVIVVVSKKCSKSDDEESEPLLRGSKRGNFDNLIGDIIFQGNSWALVFYFCVVDSVLFKQINLDNVKMLEKIGKGTFGEVFRGSESE